MKRINIKKYIHKISKKIFKAMYNKFMRVGSPRGELSIFEAKAKLSFYINLIIIIALFVLLFFSLGLFLN